MYGTGKKQADASLSFMQNRLSSAVCFRWELHGYAVAEYKISLNLVFVVMLMQRLVDRRISCKNEKNKKISCFFKKNSYI
jgi:hypothetical protein